MPDEEKTEIEDILGVIVASRRRFLAGVVGGAAFALPAIVSLPPTSVAASPPGIPLVTDEATLGVEADAILRADWKRTNEGANPRLRAGVRPRTRVIVQFDAAALAGIRNLPGFHLESAHLVVTVETNHHDWGPGRRPHRGRAPADRPVRRGQRRATRPAARSPLAGHGPGDDVEVAGGSHRLERRTPTLSSRPARLIAADSLTAAEHAV